MKFFAHIFESLPFSRAEVVFDAKKMGKNAYSLEPMRQENAH